MPAKPWVTYRWPEPNRDYLALLSELPLKRFRTLPAFYVHTWRIQAQTVTGVDRLLVAGAAVPEEVLDSLRLGK